MNEILMDMLRACLTINARKNYKASFRMLTLDECGGIAIDVLYKDSNIYHEDFSLDDDISAAAVLCDLHNIILTKRQVASYEVSYKDECISFLRSFTTSQEAKTYVDTVNLKYGIVSKITEVY